MNRPVLLLIIVVLALGCRGAAHPDEEDFRVTLHQQQLAGPGNELPFEAREETTVLYDWEARPRWAEFDETSSIVPTEEAPHLFLGDLRMTLIVQAEDDIDIARIEAYAERHVRAEAKRLGADLAIERVNPARKPGWWERRRRGSVPNLPDDEAVRDCYGDSDCAPLYLQYALYRRSPAEEKPPTVEALTTAELRKGERVVSRGHLDPAQPEFASVRLQRNHCYSLIFMLDGDDFETLPARVSFHYGRGGYRVDRAVLSDAWKRSLRHDYGCIAEPETVSYGAALEPDDDLPPKSIAYALVAKRLNAREALDYWCEHCGRKYGDARTHCYRRTRVGARACARR